jgi:hypothetical protein
MKSLDVGISCSGGKINSGSIGKLTQWISRENILEEKEVNSQ